MLTRFDGEKVKNQAPSKRVNITFLFPPNRCKLIALDSVEKKVEIMLFWRPATC